MSETKFTPGPWRANFEDYTKPYVEILNEDNLVIAQIPDGEIIRGDKTILGLENIEANINLIADAWQLPDLRKENTELKAINNEMYEALEAIDETYKYKRIPDIRRKGHTILKDEIRGGAVFTYDDIKKVREALRKARGEEE